MLCARSLSEALSLSVAPVNQSAQLGVQPVAIAANTTALCGMAKSGENPRQTLNVLLARPLDAPLMRTLPKSLGLLLALNHGGEVLVAMARGHRFLHAGVGRGGDRQREAVRLPEGDGEPHVLLGVLERELRVVRIE